MADENTSSLVIDTGSWLTKAGLSNDDYPRIVTPSVMGRDANTNLSYYGKEALEKQNEFTIEPLLTNGKPNDWQALESFWQFVCFKELELDLPDRSVLTNYYPNTSKFVKERTIQIFFESFNVPFYFAASNALLTLYSSGRVNGLVIDSGDQVTSIMPIYEGCPMPFGQVTMSIGGNDITSYLAATLNTDTSSARDIKEKYCRISMEYEKELAEQKNESQPEKLLLPDNREIDVRDWNIRAAESIFNPEVIDESRPGLTSLVMDSLMKTDHDYRKEFMSNVIISGGNTNFPLLHERLQRELGAVLPSFMKVKCYNLPDKINSVWFGGAIVSSLGTFQPLLISRSEYDEIGPSIVNRKCI